VGRKESKKSKIGFRTTCDETKATQTSQKGCEPAHEGGYPVEENRGVKETNRKEIKLNGTPINREGLEMSRGGGVCPEKKSILTINEKGTPKDRCEWGEKSEGVPPTGGKLHKKKRNEVVLN